MGFLVGLFPNKRTGTYSQNGLRLLGLNLAFMGSFAAVMGLNFVTASYTGFSIPPGLVILCFICLAVFAWYRFGRSVPRNQSLRSLLATSLLGKAPLILGTLILYLLYLVKGPENCSGAHILLMYLGSMGTIFGFTVLFIGYRGPR